MSEVYDWTVRKLIEVAASDAPTPGGGSVSALAASLGVAMVAMVANLTAGKEQYKEVQAEVDEIRRDSYYLLATLENLVDQDIAEFSRFMSVLKLPRASEEEKARREEQRQAALVSATDTPLAIAAACLEALELARRLAAIGNKGAISDAGVAAYLAEAALHSALLSVDINLPGIKDEVYSRQAARRRRELAAQARELREAAVARVEERLS